MATYSTTYRKGIKIEINLQNQFTLGDNWDGEGWLVKFNANGEEYFTEAYVSCNRGKRGAIYRPHLPQIKQACLDEILMQDGDHHTDTLQPGWDPMNKSLGRLPV